MKPITNQKINDICNVVYPMTKYLNALGKSGQDIGHSCILINFLSKKIIEEFMPNIEAKFHFGDVWYILNTPYKLKWGINEHTYRNQGIGHCFLTIKNRQEETEYYIDFTSFLFNRAIANMKQDNTFNQVPKKIFFKKIIEKQLIDDISNNELKEGDYFYEISPRHIEEKNKNIIDLNYIPTKELYDWYKSQKKELIIKYNGKETKLYLDKNNVNKNW